MFTGLPGSFSLLAAQAASFNKGQESQTSSTNERLERQRKRVQHIVLTQATQDDEKTPDTKHGFLA